MDRCTAKSGRSGVRRWCRVPRLASGRPVIQRHRRETRGRHVLTHNLNGGGKASACVGAADFFAGAGGSELTDALSIAPESAFVDRAAFSGWPSGTPLHRNVISGENRVLDAFAYCFKVDDGMAGAGGSAALL